MREKIENNLIIDVEGAGDLSTATDLLVWIRQGQTRLTYTPTVLSPENILVKIPFSDAMTLNSYNPAEVQLVGTDADGNPFASEPVKERVGRLLSEEGYDAPD